MTTKDQVTCRLCDKPFTDPRFLPCLHSFCCQCLQKEVDKAEPQQSIQCPTCQRRVTLPMGEASTLPRNLHLEFEVEVADCMSKFVSDAKIPCTFCANGCTNPAVVFCCSCHKFLCEGGEDSHSRVPQLVEHRVVSMNEETAALLPTIMRPVTRYCPQPRHAKQELDYYCKTCSCFICRECFITVHNNHAITELSAVAEGHRDEMKGVVQYAREADSMLTNAIGTKNKAINQLETSKKEAELAIKSAFDLLMGKLEERKKAMLLELESTSLSKMAPLSLQKEQLEKFQHDVGHYTDVASHILQTNTDYEVVALGDLVPTEMKATLKKAENASNAPTQHSFLKVSVQTDALGREISRFGSVYDLSADPSKCMFRSIAMMNAKYHIKVETGHRYLCTGLEVKSELDPEEPDGVVISEEAEDQGNGTYTIALAPQSTGPQRVHIVMDGQQLEEDITSNALGNTQLAISVDQPYCVAIDDNGDIFVGSNDDCIYVFGQDGHLKSTIGHSGNGNGQFNVPADILIKGDVMYVADLCNNRVQKLTTKGEFLHAFGETGSYQGQFSGPSGIVMDSNDRLIISDRDNHRVQIFTQNGEWLSTIDGNGNEESVFSDPCGLTLDPQENIHVAAGGSNAIKVFSPDGTYVRTYGEVKGPTGIAVDEEGYSLVSEGDGHCLSIFDPQGRKVHTVGNLNNPSGVTLDARSGSVYVANFIGCSVVKYTF